MTPDDQQCVINELQMLIEETGMDEEMPEDYDRLLSILDGAIKQQRKHTEGLLG
ncbi:hypothetical protein [Vreelandella andesensis]|uniref:hypothetical protein n=1 Tax=Vreelandella andesensis TaxID=447567 RepID=UPI00142E5FA5|nr:hypothetical protein [Halomonas andesensis]